MDPCIVTALVFCLQSLIFTHLLGYLMTVAVSSTAQPVAMQTGDDVDPAIPPATPALMKEHITAPAVVKVNNDQQNYSKCQKQQTEKHTKN